MTSRFPNGSPLGPSQPVLRATEKSFLHQMMPRFLGRNDSSCFVASIWLTVSPGIKIRICIYSLNQTRNLFFVVLKIPHIPIVN